MAVESSPAAIVLVGFMGAGKTSVGRALARILQWQFEDLDDRIECRERRRVEQIFRESGESAFRDAETAALKELLAESQRGSPAVVALGGGAFAQPGNVKLIQAAGVSSVYLHAPVEELWRRCCNQRGHQRPLARTFDQFRQLFRAREGFYVRASLCQPTDGKTVRELAHELARKLEVRTKHKPDRKGGEQN